MWGQDIISISRNKISFASLSALSNNHVCNSYLYLGLVLVCLCIIFKARSVWKHRNEVCFNNKKINTTQVLMVNCVIYKNISCVYRAMLHISSSKEGDAINLAFFWHMHENFAHNSLCFRFFILQLFFSLLLFFFLQQQLVPQHLYSGKGVRNLSPISAIAVLPLSRLFIVGTEDGVLKICS